MLTAGVNPACAQIIGAVDKVTSRKIPHENTFRGGLLMDAKARSADFGPPSAASRWAEGHEICLLTAGVNPACAQIIGAVDRVNSRKIPHENTFRGGFYIYYKARLADFALGPVDTIEFLFAGKEGELALKEWTLRSSTEKASDT